MDRTVIRRRTRLAAAGMLATVVMLGGISGCGGDPRDAEPTDYGVLNGLVSGVRDGAEDEIFKERFTDAFVEGAAPEADRAKYAPPFEFEIKGDPEISENSATFTVAIGKRDPETGEVADVGEKDWSAEKVGGAWKLKTAPVP